MTAPILLLAELLWSVICVDCFQFCENKLYFETKIHEKRDDLGRGKNKTSKNGNSGRRLACGLIGWAKSH
jgi:hypothetical protein